MNQLFGLQHRGDRYLSHSSRHTQVSLTSDYQRHTLKERTDPIVHR